MVEIAKQVVANLISLAKQASQRAYCPYSSFRVGAALLTDSGAVFSGCNVENASYGLTMCAERSAVFQMVAQGEGRIKMIVMYTPTPTPSTPCGACREVIKELGPNACIICVCDGPGTSRATISEMLPAPFGPA
jgi:cytidine deaminase